METRTITGVENTLIDHPNGVTEPVWNICMDIDDGRKWTYIIPHCTFHWRSVEYGIDPEDFETLLDIALHEHHVNLQHTDPTFLYNTDEGTARKAHLARIAEAKTRVAHLDPQNHLDVIRKAYDSVDSQREERLRIVTTLRAQSLKAKLQ